MARPVDTKTADETALSTTASRLPAMRVRVEDFPWAEPWSRVTTALSNAVAVLARKLSWQDTARECGLNWKSVPTIVKRTVRLWPGAPRQTGGAYDWHR